MEETEAGPKTEPTQTSPPRSNTIRILVIAGFALVLLIIGGTWAANYFTVERPLQRVLSTDQRNHVCKAKAHFGGWVDPKTLVFDVTGVSGDATRLDVFRAFLQFAEAMKDQHFAKVVLAARGTNKFTLDGNYFQELGREYNTQNPMYTILTFPPHLAAMDGTKPFSEYEGGVLAVLPKEMEQFTDFSDQWYLRDFQAEPRSSAVDASGPANFDPCESIRKSDPHCGWKSHWEDSGTSVSAIDGVKTEFLSMESTDPDGIDFGDLHYADLRICFEDGKLCGGKHVAVGVTVHGMLASKGYDSEYSTGVRLKFDDEKPMTQTWGISDSHETLFPDGKEEQFLSQLVQHNKLVLEFSYYEKAARTVSFDLAGLADKMKADNLEGSFTRGPKRGTRDSPTGHKGQDTPPAANPSPTTQSEHQADLDEAGPKPTAQARTDTQCPRIETGTFVFSPGPTGHFWKFCSKGEHPVCFSKETTDFCFK